MTVNVYSIRNGIANIISWSNNQIWFGQMSNGDYVIGLFNRGDNSIAYNVSFADLGIAGEWKVRDLWRHADEGTASSISATVAPHGCKIVRLSK